MNYVNIKLAPLTDENREKEKIESVFSSFLILTLHAWYHEVVTSYKRISIKFFACFHSEIMSCRLFQIDLVQLCSYLRSLC